uniref:calcium-binding protein n=1 Tax=Actibacterium sp. MT2.3-13A TaxID=2828332 RepID=UPI0032C222AC
MTRNIVLGAVTTFDGTGFAFRGEDVVGGTINSVTFRQGGTTVARVEGISWSAVAFVDALIDIVDFDDWSAFDALMNASAPITYDATAATNPGHADFLGLAVPVTYLGSAFGDYVRGTASGDRLEGRDGDDSLGAGAGNDTIWAGAGDDLIYGGDGDDRIGAGLGADEIWTGAGADLAYGGPGINRIGGGAGNDTLWGGADGDSIYGGND